MSKIWKGQSNQTKLRILKACVFPIALYGCEIWTLHQSDIDRIQAFEMTCYRKILQITWKQKITNEEVRKRMNLKGIGSHLIHHIKKQKLSYFGHIKRHNTIEKTIMEGKVEGKRSRGRPRRQWKDDIVSWLQVENITEAGRLALDRASYRNRVWAATSFTRDMP